MEIDVQCDLRTMTTITQLSIHEKSLDEAKTPRLKIHDLVLCNRRCDSFTPFYGRGKKLQFYAINRDTGRMLLRLFSQLKMQHRAKKVQLKKCAMTEEKNEFLVLLGSEKIAQEVLLNYAQLPP